MSTWDYDLPDDVVSVRRRDLFSLLYELEMSRAPWDSPIHNSHRYIGDLLRSAAASTEEVS